MKPKTSKKTRRTNRSRIDAALTADDVCTRLTEATMPVVHQYLDEVCKPIKLECEEYDPMNLDVELAMHMITLCGAKILIEEIDRVKDEARRRHATVLKRRPRIEQVRKLAAALLREVVDEIFGDPVWDVVRKDKAEAKAVESKVRT